MWSLPAVIFYVGKLRPREGKDLPRAPGGVWQERAPVHRHEPRIMWLQPFSTSGPREMMFGCFSSYWPDQESACCLPSSASPL